MYNVAKSEVNLYKFVEYVYSFYGVVGAIYPLEREGIRVSREDIRNATLVYLESLVSGETKDTWGDGDSMDRERVRYIS